MKVRNMTSAKGNKIANQFIITDSYLDENGRQHITETFQGYNSVIATVKDVGLVGEVVSLDAEKWDYSVTTGKYRNQFLGEGVAETRKKIASGEYKLVDLN